MMDESRFTPRGKKTLDLAYREALSLGRSEIDTADLYRAVIRQLQEVDWDQLGSQVGDCFNGVVMGSLARMDKA